MIDAGSAAEIINLYRKHGWVLRRVLLSGHSQKNLNAEIFGDCEFKISEIDALWFSRRSKPGSETWELRRLGGTPYALIEVIDDDLDEAARENVLKEIEVRMSG